MCRVAWETFASTRSAPAQVRRWLRERLDVWELVDTDGSVLLLTSELVTNAVLYGSGPVRVALSVADAVLEVAVADHGSDPGIAAHRAGELVAGVNHLAEGGRGLPLVAAMSQQWGVTPIPDGKQVWFRQPAGESWPHASACPCPAATDAQVLASGHRAQHIPGPWLRAR